MRYVIAFGCLLGFLSMCVLAVIHVLYEMWRHGPYSDSDPPSCGASRERQFSRDVSAGHLGRCVESKHRFSAEAREFEDTRHI